MIERTFTKMYVGVDLGGTKIATALVNDEGVIVKRILASTVADGGSDDVVKGVMETCDALLAGVEKPPLSIGIGVPGTVREDIGMVVFTPNLPLRDVPMADILGKVYNCPVLLGNDANCAALGEVVAGGAKGAKDVVMITLGTGLGGGVIIGGKLRTGLTGAGGELGHMVIFPGGRECGCGRRGCWETYGAATGLKNTALEYMKNNKNSMMWELCRGTTNKLNGKIIFQAYRAKDPAAIFTVSTYIEHLAIGVVNIINMLEPELICVGGGISNAWDCINKPLTEAVEKEKFMRFSKDVPGTKLVRATLGNDAGIIGAAMLGKH